jgi:hypothetical protein
MSTVTLRPGRTDDAAAVATIWETGWRDGHLGNVPEALVAIRTPESFRTRAAERVADTTVAEVAGHRSAWLAVVPGNTRARRFYERCGWIDDGTFDYAVPHDGEIVHVPCHRYVKPM